MTSRLHRWCAAFVSVIPFLLTLASVPISAVQSTDQVHAVPRDVVGPSLRRAGVGTASTDTHLKPFRVDVDLVVVPVTVTNAMSRPVTNLQRDDFAVYEDDKQQIIRHFAKEDEPISIGLVLDFSASMQKKVETERKAVTEFFNNANSEDEFFAIAVSSRPHVISEPTQSKAYIEARLASETPNGGTALLDSIYLALSKMRSTQYHRRALLIVSDGGDNSSRYRLKQIKDLAQESDVPIYAIGLFDSALFKPFEELMGRRWLQEITDATGGRTTTVDNLSELPEIAAAISWELRTQYILAFRSDNPSRNGKRRQIKVRAISSNSRDLHFHYKRSYFVSAR